MPNQARRNTKRKRPSRRAGRSTLNRGSGFHIPPIKSNIVVKHRFRFLASGAVAGVVLTASDVLKIAGNVAYITNTTGLNIAQSFKIKELFIYSPPPAQGSSATCAVEWAGTTTSSLNTSSLEFSDTSINPSSPAYLAIRPPSGCLASFWNTAGTATLLTITCPTASVVDVDLEYIVTDDPGDYSTYAYQSGAATIGTLYYLPLTNGVANTLRPVSLNANN